MNTEANTLQSPPLAASHAVAPAIVSPTRRFAWSLRRELWENRSLYIAPLAVAGLILFGFLLSTRRLADSLRTAATLTAPQQHAAIEAPYNMAALVLMVTTLLVALFYSLEALYGERRDRSIFFWKSLPVSDLTTVLAKASIPILILPVVTFAITFATQCGMLLIQSVVLLGSGLSLSLLWSNLPLFPMSVMLLFHLLAIHGLYYAPVYGYLLLVSAWARRVPLLWALLPPLAIAIVEKIAFNTTFFAGALVDRIGGGAEGGAMGASVLDMDSLGHLSVLHFLLNPGLWIGFALAAACLYGAVYLRHSREPI